MVYSTVKIIGTAATKYKKSLFRQWFSFSFYNCSSANSNKLCSTKL